MRQIAWSLVWVAACSLEAGVIPPVGVDDGGEPSAGEGGVSDAPSRDVGIVVDASDATLSIIDDDASRGDAGGATDTTPGCVPSTETCDGLDEDCDGAIDEGATCPCPRYTFGGSTYLFCTGTDDFAGSQARCRAVGYELVSIESAAEDDWIWSTISGMTGDEVWIGLTDAVSEGTFVWPDGTVQRTPSGDVAYGGWITGRPDGSGDEDCVELDRGAGGEWEDVGCDQLQNAVCEAP